MNDGRLFREVVYVPGNDVSGFGIDGRPDIGCEVGWVTYLQLFHVSAGVRQRQLSRRRRVAGQ